MSAPLTIEALILSCNKRSSSSRTEPFSQYRSPKLQDRLLNLSYWMWFMEDIPANPLFGERDS